MSKLTLNGKEIAGGSRVVVMLMYGSGQDHKPIRRAYGADIAAAEDFIREMTGREPSTWYEGSGEITVCASTMPVKPEWQCPRCRMWIQVSEAEHIRACKP